MRKLRNALKRLLPEKFKQGLRTRLQGVKQDAGVSFQEEDKGCVAILKNGVRLRLPDYFKEDLVSHFSSSEEHPECMAFLAAARDAGGPFLDAGAHFGWFTVFFGTVNPDYRAVAFEPSEEVLPQTRELLAHQGWGDRIQIQPKAISDQPGELEMVMGNTLGFVQIQNFSGTGTEEMGRKVVVEVATIDQMATELGEDPALLKIDVEGFEWEALRGGEQLLRRAHPVIFLELHLNYLEERGVKAREILDWLTERGYGFHHFSGKKTSAAALAGSMKPVERFVAKWEGGTR